MMHRSLIGIFGPTCIFVISLMVTSCMDMPLTPAQVRDNHNDIRESLYRPTRTFREW